MADAEWERLFEGYQNRDVVLRAEVEHRGGKKQFAHVDLVKPEAGEGWDFACDEPPELGGEGIAPPPLAFLVAGIAFCFMSKIPQYAKVLRVEVPPVKILARWGMHAEGSARQGTLQTTPIALDLTVVVQEPDDSGALSDVVDVARRACHAVQAMAMPVPVRISIRVD